MNIDYISDVHVDFWYKHNKDPGWYIKNVLQPSIDGDLLVISGDIGHYNHQNKEFLAELLKYYPDIVMTPGNHDLYLLGNERKRFQNNSLARIKDMADFCDETKGLHWLDGRTEVIQGVKFGGVGYWYDASVDHWRNVMSDSRLVMVSKPFKVPLPYGAGYIETGFDTTRYYKSQRKKLEEMERVDVMVTHVCPTQLCKEQMPKQYIGDPNNVFYENDDGRLVGADICLFGHVHSRYDFSDFETRFLSNPVGYKGENSVDVLGVQRLVYGV